MTAIARSMPPGPSGIPGIPNAVGAAEMAAWPVLHEHVCLIRMIPHRGGRFWQNPDAWPAGADLIATMVSDDPAVIAIDGPLWRESRLQDIREPARRDRTSQEDFGLGRNHLLCPAPLAGDAAEESRLVTEALHDGHMFMSFAEHAEARGFRVWAVQAGRTAIMGDRLTAHETEFTVVLPPAAGVLATTIHLHRNGRRIARGSGPSLTYRTDEPGAYRVEVTRVLPLFGPLKRTVPWIVSNPIVLES